MQVVADVHGDTIEPAGEVAGGFDPAEIAVELQEDFLRSVLRIREVAEQAQCGDKHKPLVLPDDLLESGTVALFGRFDGRVERNNHSGNWQAAHPF